MSDEPKRIQLPPDEPGLDEETRARRVVLAKIQRMTPQEFFALAVRAGISNEDGTLTAPYASTEPSAYRPRD